MRWGHGIAISMSSEHQERKRKKKKKEKLVSTAFIGAVCPLIKGE